MLRLLAFAFAACVCLRPGGSLAQDSAKQIVGTWKLVSWLQRFDGGDAVEPLGPNPIGRLVITADGHWIVLITGSGRTPPRNSDEKAALLDSMTAYSGKYTIDGDRITTRVDMSWNELFTGGNQTRIFSVDGDELILRTGGEVVSAVRPGQRAEGTLTWERER